MRLLSLAVVLILIAAPAQADITARYAMGPPGGGMPAMVVEVNDRGDARIMSGNQAAMLTLDNVPYLIQGDLHGIYVARWDDLAALLAARFQAMMPHPSPGTRPAALPPPPPATEFFAQGNETIAGRTGTRWVLRPTERHAGRVQPEGGLDFVVSNDPELAPLGRVFLHSFETSMGGMRTMLGAEGGRVAVFGRPMLEMFARGAVLRMGNMLRLESVDTHPIPASEFVLPSAPLSRAELEARLGWQPVPATPAAPAH